MPSDHWQISVETNILVAMIFLRDNALLERDLELTDVKPRLLGTRIKYYYYEKRSTNNIL